MIKTEWDHELVWKTYFLAIEMTGRYFPSSAGHFKNNLYTNIPNEYRQRIFKKILAKWIQKHIQIIIYDQLGFIQRLH